MDNWEKTPAAIELNASFNLIRGKLVRRHNMYSTTMAPKKNGTAWQEKILKQQFNIYHMEAIYIEMASIKTSHGFNLDQLSTAHLIKPSRIKIHFTTVKGLAHFWFAHLLTKIKWKCVWTLPQIQISFLSWVKMCNIWPMKLTLFTLPLLLK